MICGYVAYALIMVLIPIVSQHPAPKMGPFFGLGIGPRNALNFSTNSASDVGLVTPCPFDGCVWGTDLLGMQRQRRSVKESSRCQRVTGRTYFVEGAPALQVTAQGGHLQVCFRYSRGGHLILSSRCLIWRSRAVWLGQTKNPDRALDTINPDRAPETQNPD